jgi:hypothetical protein
MRKFSIVTTVLFAALMALTLTPLVGVEVSTVFGVGIVAMRYMPIQPGILGLNNTNNTSARDSYNHARRMFFSAFRDKFMNDKQCQDFVDSLKLSQAEIRLEVELLATQSLFKFGVTPNQANTNNFQFPTEQRLPLQDSICVNEYGIYISKPASQADSEFLLRTYGNTQNFTAAAALAIDGGFYSNGRFVMKCNNDVVMPYRGLFNHWYKPQTQQTAALGAASPGDQIRGAEDGMITDEPNIVIIGSKNYVPQIELVNALSTVDQFTRAILIMRGIYAQNSTVVS